MTPFPRCLATPGILVLGACAVPSQGVPASEPGQRPPNVVLIVTDDQGYGDLSCSGHPTIRTPRLDALAAEGRRLTQFYVASPVCSPSRAAILTGCYPRRVGMHRHVVFPEYDYGLHTDEDTLADVLQRAGYRTACFGKWHLGHRPGMLPTDQGFDEWLGIPYSNDMAQRHRPEGNSYRFRLPLLRNDEVLEWEPDQARFTGLFTDEAVRFIQGATDAPFFLYLPHPMPHVPLYASDEATGLSPRGLYGDVIEEIDASVGRIVDALEARGVRDNTLLIFTSDNGPWAVQELNGGTAGPLRGAKGSNWEGGQRVPMIVSWPGRVAPASLMTEVVTAMDLLPTVAKIVGAPLDETRTIDGEVLTEALLGATDAHDPSGRQAPFLYYTSKGLPAGIRRGPWKLLLDGPQLYHVEHDIEERFDRATREPELAEELRGLALELFAHVESNSRTHLVNEAQVFDPETQ
ncbi:Arylsulfatase [Planctomycetes bacterium Poly30]|uniref:Arylsulfatase n=1 Tax=Saltatorellus ferox TaxID=2528018 RepID=A0A518EVI6_9BACT|nr:Arylsulfatase [Planctomycetes bacterium Poly30]